MILDGVDLGVEAEAAVVVAVGATVEAEVSGANF